MFSYKNLAQFRFKLVEVWENTISQTSTRVCIKQLDYELEISI